MESDRFSRMKLLGEELRSVDKALTRLTSKRLSILDQIAKLDAEDGASERQTASRVARLSASTPKQAAAEIATAKQVSALPKLAEAHANGEVSNSQLGAVAAIASASSEDEALTFAKTATSSQLQQRASASRGKSFEQRRKAQSDRYLGFKPEEDGQSVRIHGRLPFAESNQLEAQLRKIADRLNLCDKDRPSPSARMADALLILTKSNASQAVHEHLNPKQSTEDKAGPHTQDIHNTQTNSNTQTGGNSNSNRAFSVPAGKTAANPESTMRPKLHIPDASPDRPVKPVVNLHSEPTSETKPTSETETPFSNTVCNHATERQRDFEPNIGRVDLNNENPTSATGSVHPNRPIDAFIDYDEEPFPDLSNGTNDHDINLDINLDINHDDNQADPDLEHNDSGPTDTIQVPTVVVQRADTRLIIHWNAQTGSLNFENGLPIDHPRLQAILCDAQIDIQHCDINGLPTGLITTAHHSDWRQDRYLAYRDGPCRIPECLGIGKTQAHHIFENRIGRTTSVQHMINLCYQNHHDNIFTINGRPEQTITFTYQDGTTLTSHARPLPITLKTPKATPFTKHPKPDEDSDLFSRSARPIVD